MTVANRRLRWAIPSLAMAVLVTSYAWGRVVAVSSAQRLGHGPNGTEDARGYTVVPNVPDGGRIEGTVLFAGTVPTLTAVPVPLDVNPANRACGASIAATELVVDPTTKGVRGVVLSLVDVTRGLAPAAGTVEVDQQQCQFAPHVVALAVGSSIRFANHDPGVLHNVHGYYSLLGDETLFNLGTAPGLSVARRMDRSGIHRVVCDVGHTWMLLYTHVFKHPYFATTGADGRFSIANVPPGHYQLHAWHEGWNSTGTDPRHRSVWSAPVEGDAMITVAARGRVRADFTLDGTPHMAPTVRTRH